jgi:hypothetical protein
MIDRVIGQKRAKTQPGRRKVAQASRLWGFDHLDQRRGSGKNKDNPITGGTPVLLSFENTAGTAVLASLDIAQAFALTVVFVRQKLAL